MSALCWKFIREPYLKSQPFSGFRRASDAKQSFVRAPLNFGKENERLHTTPTPSKNAPSAVITIMYCDITFGEAPRRAARLTRLPTPSNCSHRSFFLYNLAPILQALLSTSYFFRETNMASLLFRNSILSFRWSFVSIKFLILPIIVSFICRVFIK